MTMTLARMSPYVVARLDESSRSAPVSIVERGHASSASVTTLHHGSLPLVVPARRTLVSYVLRHSASGMDVQSSTGQRCSLQAGAMLVCNGPDLVLQRGRLRGRGDCLAIDLLVSGVRNPGMFVHLDDYYPTFVNSPQGCIRLLLGTWDGRRALLAPVDGFWMLDIDIAPGEELCIPASPLGAVGVLTTGSLVVDGIAVRDTAAPMPLPAGRDSIRLGSETGASLMVFPQGFA